MGKVVRCRGLDPTIARSLLLFAAVGLCEISGGYLGWLCLLEGWAVCLDVADGLVLFLYRVLPTLQPAGAPVGRVYAADRRRLRRGLGDGSTEYGWTAGTSRAARSPRSG